MRGVPSAVHLAKEVVARLDEREVLQRRLPSWEGYFPSER